MYFMLGKNTTNQKNVKELSHSPQIPTSHIHCEYCASNSPRHRWPGDRFLNWIEIQQRGLFN